MAWESGNAHPFKERNPEKTYQAFMDLIQKIIDDHRVNLSNHLFGPSRKRLVPVPRTGTWQWNTCEQVPTRTRTKSSSAETQIPRILKDPQDNYTSEVLLSEVQRDEIEMGKPRPFGRGSAHD
ncbi:MAG: hypothetical protein Q9188_007038 [Gyalolechia gomerana]